MENKLTRFVYDHSPPLLQDLFASAYGYSKTRARYKGDFEYWLDFYKDSLHWPREKTEQWQRSELQRIIRHAYETTPFYRQRMDKISLKPDDIREVEDLAKLPLLEKDEIRLHSEEMISSIYPRKSMLSSPTGGTTGMPLKIYFSDKILERHYGYTWARWRPGLRRGEPYASFTGLQIVDPSRLTPPFWRRNYAGNQTCFSVFHLQPRFMESYLRQLGARPFAWWEGYPGAIYIIAAYIESSGVEFTNFPRAVLTTSEECQPHYRETINRVLQTRVWDSYGQGEKAGSITEYECGHYHYDMDYSILEFLPTGHVDDDGDAVCEVVSTGFVNDAWPMIRYRVGDMVTLDKETTCDYCEMPIVKRIHGRTGHMIYTPDGHTISNISVIAKKCKHTRGLQLVQERLDTVQLRIIKAENFQPEDEAYVLKQFRLKYGDKVQYQIEYVDELEQTRLGKTLSIISRLSSEEKSRAQALAAGAPSSPA